MIISFVEVVEKIKKREIKIKKRMIGGEYDHSSKPHTDENIGKNVKMIYF
jgi:hypothetical protein